MNHLTYTFAAALVAFSLTLPDLSILQDGAVSQPASKPAVESQPANPFAWPVETAAKRIPTRRTQGNVVITNATVIPVSSPASERASILVRGGKIAAIGTNITIPEGSAVIDARGMYVVPGAMDCHSHLAIEGDVNEGSDSITAECKIGDVINPDDLSIYRALAGGCTSARLLHGSANAIGGEHAIIKLKWNRTAQDLLLTDAKRGIKFALGENPKRSNGRDPNRPLRYPATRMGVEAVIRRSFDEAKDLIQQKKDDLEKISRGEFVPPRRRDSRLETLASILSGDVDIHSHCYRSDEILMLLETADHYGIKVKTLQHVLEGFKVAPEIALHGAGASTFSDWWAYKMEAYDATPYNAALMVRAGVNVTINSDSAELIRRLHLDSGKSIRYGMLTVDECLSLVTLNTAMQLGIEKRMGSIEVGKDADLAIFDAHPLSVEAKCIYTLVDGEIEFERTDAFANLAAELLKLRKEGPASKPAYAATTPWAKTPAIPSPPLEKIAIIRATVVPVSGPAIADGTVIIEDGRITAVGPALPAPT
ncbi:MAG: amidohydrolase family protein, partial [Planctomycetota bacterium]